MNSLTWIEISKRAIKHNVDVLRKLIGPRVLLAPCIKANAYGHGLIGIAKVLIESKVDWLCVKSIEEAEALRLQSIRLPILMVGYVQVSDLERAIRCEARIRLDSREVTKALSKIATRINKTIPVHIKVDTGMTRLGVHYENVHEFISFVTALPSLTIEGISTHFANSDEPENAEFFQKQLKAFDEVKRKWHSKFPKCIFHAANSAATLLYPQAHYDLVRPGLALYGYYPSETVKKLCAHNATILKPTLTFKTRIASLKEVPAGSKVSYGCTFETKRRTKVAVLPVGYCDGFDRGLSNCGSVLIRGKKAKIVGRVCMNLTAVDVTEINDVSLEDEVVLIGKQNNEEITIEEIANMTQTINYEVTTRLAESVPRYLID